jgi:hypothetical protein
MNELPHMIQSKIKIPQLIKRLFIKNAGKGHKTDPQIYFFFDDANPDLTKQQIVTCKD